jgi:signal transduction histidine kinase
MRILREAAASDLPNSAGRISLRAVMHEQQRADEGAPGSGLGLAIVRDLAEAYAGSVALGRSPDGGVRSRLTLPSLTAGVAP